MISEQRTKNQNFLRRIKMLTYIIIISFFIVGLALPLIGYIQNTSVYRITITSTDNNAVKLQSMNFVNSLGYIFLGYNELPYSNTVRCANYTKFKISFRETISINGTIQEVTSDIFQFTPYSIEQNGNYAFIQLLYNNVTITMELVHGGI